MQFLKRIALMIALSAGCANISVGQELVLDTLQLTLADAWHRADTASKAIKIQRFNALSKTAEKKDLEIERYPEVGVAGSIEKATNIPIYDEGLLNKPSQHEVIHTLYRVGADFNLNIYNGNKLNLRIASAGVEQNIAGIEESQMTSSQYLRVASIYLELQKSFVFQTLIKEAIAEREAQLTEIKEFYKNGVKLKNDVLRVELDLSKQRQILLEINNDIKLLTQSLNIIIGLPDERAIKPDALDIAKMPTVPSYEDCLTQGRIKAYPYLISGEKVKLSELEVKQIKSNQSVKVNMYGEFYYANPQIFLYPYNPYWYSLGIAGVKASFPISSLYHNLYKMKKAKIELEKEEEQHKNTDDVLRKEIKEGYLRYEEAIERISVRRTDVSRAEENERIVKENYFNQTLLITDLLDAELQSLQSKFDIVSAAVVAKYKFYQLQNSIGTLTAL